MPSPHRFPLPWSVDKQEACFIVRDANGLALAAHYFEDEPGRPSAARLLTRDKARRIAANIAKLPEPDIPLPARPLRYDARGSCRMLPNLDGHPTEALAQVSRLFSWVKVPCSWPSRADRLKDMTQLDRAFDHVAELSDADRVSSTSGPIAGTKSTLRPLPRFSAIAASAWGRTVLMNRRDRPTPASMRPGAFAANIAKAAGGAALRVMQIALGPFYSVRHKATAGWPSRICPRTPALVGPIASKTAYVWVSLQASV